MDAGFDHQKEMIEGLCNFGLKWSTNHQSSIVICFINIKGECHSQTAGHSFTATIRTSNATGATSDVGAAHPSGADGFILVSCVVRSLVFSVCFMCSFLYIVVCHFFPIFFGHCIVCSSIYGI